MDSKETHQQQNRDAAALADTTPTSQAVHNRSSVEALSLRQPQPQQPLMQLGTEKRGRGRPRKYAPPDVVIDGGDSGGGANANNPSSGPPAKRGRGRPLGSRTKQNLNALGGGEGGPLTAHVIDVNAGEDIATKLREFINQEPRNVCILSASGAVSSSVLHSSDRLVRFMYKGLYDIIDMSMSPISLDTESDGTLIRIASLNVSLAGPDCKVVGGCVGGMLVAASQVKVIVGTFGPEVVKLSAASEPANVLSSSGDGGPVFPQSQGPQRSSESSEESPLHQAGNSTPQPPHHLSLWPSNNPQ
ncbi:hypothetical protein Bca4012_062051 [Brassica carinata]